MLKEHEADGTAKEIFRRHGTSEQTFYRWKSKYGGVAVSGTLRLRDLEAEDARLKHLLAMAHLGNFALQDFLSKTGEACCREARGGLSDVMAQLQLAPSFPAGGAVAIGGAGPPQARDDGALQGRMKELAAVYRRDGYLCLRVLLSAESLMANAKRT